MVVVNLWKQKQGLCLPRLATWPYNSTFWLLRVSETGLIYHGDVFYINCQSQDVWVVNPHGTLLKCVQEEVRIYKNIFFLEDKEDQTLYR